MVGGTGFQRPAQRNWRSTRARRRCGTAAPAGTTNVERAQRIESSGRFFAWSLVQLLKQPQQSPYRNGVHINVDLALNPTRDVAEVDMRKQLVIIRPVRQALAATLAQPQQGAVATLDCGLGMVVGRLV